MTALFRGGELEAFIPSGSGVDERSTDGFNTTFCRCSIGLGAGSSSNPGGVSMDTMSWSAQSGDLYLHFEEQGGGGAVTHTALELYSGTTANFRIRQTNVTIGAIRTWQLQYLDGSAVWTNAGSALTLSTARADYDLYVNITNGDVALYVRGSDLGASATGLSLGHMSGVTKARFYSDFSIRRISQVIADTVSTVGRRLATAYPSGVGANTSWTGSYTEVDEIVLDDADFINSATADQLESYAVTVPTLTGYVVQDVTVSTRAKCGSAGPQNMRHVLRSGSTNGLSGSDIALTAAYAPQQTTFTTDPATSAAWVNTAIASVQPGAKSIT
jgi:hypothetical protein